MPKDVKNWLYYGDNLEMLRHVRDESVDLVYLDPPFKSDANYNMLFKERDGSQVAAQIKAFEDTWTWDPTAARAYDDVIARGGPVADALRSFRILVGGSDMLAYLSMMAPRLVELHRVLKPTGSLYLHCDPTASHYLKLLLDSVFGPKNFRSEIVWKRSSAHNDAKQGRKDFGHIHDAILFYTKTDRWSWTTQYTPFDPEYVGRDYRLVDEEGRRFRRGDLTAAKPGGDTEYEWPVKKRSGVKERWVADLNDEYRKPRSGWDYKMVRPYDGRYWAYSRENMRQFASEGRLRHTFDGMPEYKRFLDEMEGVPLQDVWTDIKPLGGQAAERLGYPTQKPEALLDRIILTSTAPGDVVLDPFCGCGTSIASAQRLGRRWIGIDITSLAIGLIEQRLEAAWGKAVRDTYDLKGAPTNATEAAHLARVKPMAFQDWIVDRLGARPGARGADGGIDGKLFFKSARGDRTYEIIISVKGGKLNANFTKQLLGVVAKDNATIGVLVTLHKPTAAMKKDAANAGFVETDWGRYPRLQILTIEDYFAGKSIQYPRVTGTDVTFKKAPKAKAAPRVERLELFSDGLAGTALSRNRPAAASKQPVLAKKRHPTLREERPRRTGSARKR